MSKQNKKNDEKEEDSSFILKIVIYILLASLWIKFQVPIELGLMTISGLPVGLLVGLILASQDRFQIDRKIEYVVLFIMTIITYFLPAGIVI
ncbi:MAG: hypothetical protein AAB395_03130 [Patescibacteria group bacterium]